MFERYTESARRALFYARYEASELGARSVDTEHLLLGVLREPVGITAQLLDDVGLNAEVTRKEVASRFQTGEKVPTSVELPFTAAAKRVLHFASSEADALEHPYIGSEHVLLALLREQDGPAAPILGARALKIDDVRRRFVELLGEGIPLVHDGTVDRIFENRIEFAKRLVMQLAEMPPGATAARELAHQIVDMLDSLKDELSE